MISLDDVRWSRMTGGYKMLLDPRPLLQQLEDEDDTTEVWKELWNELHHQGDVGDASFASVPFLVQSYRQKGVIDWNTYALVAVIELARRDGKNPDVPQWLADDYFQAIRELAETGATELFKGGNADDVRAILSVIAIQRGLRTHGSFLVKYSEEELQDIEAGL
jgi:hypothetical protein